MISKPNSNSDTTGVYKKTSLNQTLLKETGVYKKNSESHTTNRDRCPQNHPDSDTTNKDTCHQTQLWFTHYK